MKEIKSTRNGKTARVSDRLAKALVSSGKYQYRTTEMRPQRANPVPVQPAVEPADPIIDVTSLDSNAESLSEAEISPITGKPKRQYRRRAAKASGEEE